MDKLNMSETTTLRLMAAAKEFNIAVQSFPGSFVAGMKNLKPRPYFQAEAGAKANPKVEF